MSKINLEELHAIAEKAVKDTEEKIHNIEKRKVETDTALLKDIAKKIVNNIPINIRKVAEKGVFQYYILKGHDLIDHNGESIYHKGHDHFNRNEANSVHSQDLLPYVTEELRTTGVEHIEEDYHYHDHRNAGDEFDYDDGMKVGGKELLIRF